MKLFCYKGKGLVVLAWAFNRGHAAKQIAKTVEGRGQVFDKGAPLEEIPEADPKGAVHIVHEGEHHLVPLDPDE